MIRHRGRFSVLVAATLAASLASCSGDDDDDGFITDVPDACRDLARAASIPDNAFLIAIRDRAFSPETLTVPRNSTVYWINCESQANVAHTVSSVDGTWRSDELARGRTYSRAFPQAVPHPFYSVQHPTARGTVLVN